MSHKVLYRKYRPTSLDSVVGQPQVTDVLRNALDHDKISHAYLFIGPRGTGKTSVARIFAHAINHFDYQVEDNCLDIIEIDAASNTGVDNIRELREKAVIAPTSGRYKVYIIDEVHMLTKSASNALLKTLEEPPEHVVFIMATTDAHKVPITISSRTQVFTFKLTDTDTMLSHLKSIATKENIDITEDALKLVVRRGGGSFRDSLSLLDQISNLATGQITADTIERALGLPQEQSVQELLSAYASRDQQSIHQTLKDLLNSGIKPETIAAELIEHIIADPNPSHLDLLATLPDVQPPFPEAKLLLALLKTSTQSPATSFQSTTPSHPTATANHSLQAQTPPTTQTITPPQPSAESAPAAADSAAAARAANIREQLLARRKASAARAATQPDSPIESSPSSPDVSELNATFAPVSSDGSFDWEHFLDTIKHDNGAIHAQLQKVSYELDGDTLHIYPEHQLTKNILDKPNNQQLLARHLGGLSFEIHDIGEKEPPKDPTLSQISAIMGDIREVNGESPF